MSIISDSMLRSDDDDRASAQYASSQPYSQTYSNSGSSSDNQVFLERIFNGLGAASDWISNNVDYIENSPFGQWVGNNVEYVENSPIGQAISEALEPERKIYNGLPALLGAAANVAVTPKDNDTYSGNLYNSVVNGMANTVGGISDFAHQDALANFMYTLAKRTQDDTPVQADWDWNYITSPHGLTRSTGNAIGSMIPLLPAMRLAPESLVSMAGRFSPWLANGVRYGFTAIPEAMAEGGQTRREAIDEGLDHPDLRAFGTMAKNLPLLAVSNTLEGSILGGGLGKALAGKAGESFLGRVAKAPFRATPSALAEGLQNGLEEGLQQGIQNESVDQEYGYLPWNWTDDQWDAAKEGFFGTLPLGGIGGARKAIFPGAEFTSPETDIATPGTDPVEMAQLTNKNDDVPTADGVDVTSLNPDDYMKWYEEKVQDIQAPNLDTDMPDITPSTPKAPQVKADASALEGAPQYTVSGEVSSTDVTPLTDQKMRLLDSAYFNKYGRHLYITSMKRNGNGDSCHDSGQAFDTADDNLEGNKEARDWLISEGEKIGLTPLDEYEHPSAHATGGHIHFSDHGEPINADLSQDTQGDNTQNEQNNNAPASDLSNLPVGDIAAAISQNTGLPANFIWAQLSHESDGGTSPLARQDHNYGGVTGEDGNFLHFDSDQDFIDYMSKYYPKYRENGIYDAKTADEFAEALKNGGYFTADLGEYEGGMHRYLKQAGLPDNAMSGSLLTKKQFGDLFTYKMIDFAQTNDDTVKTVFNDISKSKDKSLVELFAPYMQAGKFANTADARTALASDNGFRQAMNMFIQANLDKYAPKMKDGVISVTDAMNALRPHATETQAPHIETGNLSAKQKKAVLAAANEAFQIPQGLPANEEVNFLNKLSKAIAHKDYQQIFNLIPAQASEAAFGKNIQSNSSQNVNNTPDNKVTSIPDIQGNTPANTQENAPVSTLESVPNAQETANNNAQAPSTNVQTPANQAVDVPDRVQQPMNMQTPVQNVENTQGNTVSPTVVNTLNTMAPKTRDNARVKELGEMPEGARKELGSNYLNALRDNNVSFSEKKLANPLMNGKPEAIEFAERKYGDVLNAIAQAIEAGKENANESTQGKNYRAQDQSSKNTDQYTEPEPGETAEPQRTPEESEVTRPIAPAANNAPNAPVTSAAVEGDNTAIQVPPRVESYNKRIDAPRKALDNGLITFDEFKKKADQIGDELNNDSELSQEEKTAAAKYYNKIYLGAVKKENYRVKKFNQLKEEREKEAVAKPDEKPAENTELAKLISKHPGGEPFYRIALSGAPDYHGFFADADMKPSAIRKVRSVLEAVGSSFGAGKGSMSVKRLMESLARSPYTKESTKETSSGAVQYMLNGNRVPKAAYRYYQHLKSIGYSEGQDGNKKAADEGGRTAEEIKQSLVELANRAWSDSKAQGRVSFAPSKKLRDKVQELFGHDIDEVFITADDMRHIKNDHGANEEKRGQVNITSDEIVGLYDTVNDFNSAAIQKADSKGNKKLLVVRGSNGKSYSLLIERGKHKAEVKTFYKYKEKTSPMSDAHSPERNVQNDSAKSSSTPSVAQEQESGKKNISPMGKAIPGVKGKDATVVTDSGKEIHVRYVLVPDDKVITSHDAKTMASNKAYPQELQPRDRQRTAMQEQVRNMANNIRPEDLGAGRNLNQGAPVIRKDGVVLNGNGRAMAIQLAYTKADTAKAYKKYIFDHADEFGVPQGRVKSLHKPMLVRMVTDDVNQETMRDIIDSTTGGSRMGASEQAKTDAGKIKIGDLNRYVENDAGDLTTAANRDFVNGIFYRIAGQNEINAYTDKDGNINADGIQRVKRALFSLAYGDDNLIAKMAESTDDNIRNVSNALMNAAPAMAKVNLEMKDGALYHYDAAKTISEAVKRLSTLRDEGKPVSAYLNEQSMFSEYKDSDETRDVLRFFDMNKRSTKRISTFLKAIADEIEKQGGPDQTSLMDVKPSSLREIIAYASKYAAGEEIEKAKAEETLAPGYRTESGKPLSEADEREFILKPDGSKDFGEITDEIAAATNGELFAAPIRLQVGNAEFGYKHLCGHASQMKQKGYDVMDYINHILKNFNQVYDQRTEKRPYRFVLYCKDDSKGFMPLDITLDKAGDYYTIVSTMPHRAKINGTLLFDGSANPSASTTKGTLLEETSDNGGAGTSPNTHGKNNVPSTSSVAQEQEGGKKKAVDSDAAKKDDSIFGSVEDADREMLDALGLSEEDLNEEVLEAPEGISNTAEERERLEKELAAELNKISANPVFNPKIYTLGLKLAMTYVKDGYNTFKKLVAKLHAAFGDKIGPWAPALAETVRTWPKGVPFDAKKVMAISKAVGARYEGGITSLDAMQDDMKKLLKGQHKSFAPMIEASYNGIRKFFDEKEAENHGDEGRQAAGEIPDAGREGRQSATLEGAGAGRTESGGVSGAEGGKRPVTRGGDSGRTEGENPERAESSGVRAGTELETAAGTGTGKRGAEKPVSLTEAQEHPSPEETPGHDYEIKPGKVKKTPAVRFRQNIDAIKLLKQLEADGRMPTPKEQAVLGNYNGWGGLKEAFLDTKMNKELRAVLTPEEYKAAQSTVNDAFYTPAGIVRAVWKGVSRLGFTGGRVLDPSMGVGNFFGCMPRDMMKNSSLRGIEIDDLTSRMAHMLYPSALVEHTGFEKAQLADNFYDLAISNIPFNANLSIAGYRIHNYFFAHGMDKVRPGGLMVYITSQGALTNSKDGARMRDYLGKKADMVAAYKLPSGAFGESGTSVGTDIVIFRKRGEHEMKPDYAQDFQHVGKMFTTTNMYGQEQGGVPVNEYFKAHPENIIGEASKGRDQYGNDVLLVKPKEGTDVARELSRAMNKLPKDIYEPVNRTGEDSFDSIKANIKLRADYKRNHDLEYWEKDGKIYQNRYRDHAGIMAEEIHAGKKLTRLKGYLKIRSALNSLMLAEMDPEAKKETVNHLRKQLNTVYDAYVKKNGYLNDPQGQRAYIDDPSSGMVMALEKVTYTGFGAKKKIEKVEKAAIFKERSIAPIKEATSVDSPSDALIVSLRNKGFVDLPYMAKLMGSTPETVTAGLDGQIFKNPATERYETRDEYLSGNVREKLVQAENATAQDPSYQKNVDALKKVVPKDLIPDEICVTMGAPWIPASDVQDFADHITGRAGSLSVKFIPSIAKWVVYGYGSSGKYKTKGIDLAALLSHILNNKAIEIYSGSGKERTLDREATDAANVIAQDIKDDFTTWLWSDKARAKRLARYYNDNYNNTVLREYDGSHLTFPGHNAKIELKPHQKNVVWRMLQGGNTLIAHCVGAGKTFEMQAAGMEMRRLGIANKPLYILPNNVVEQFTREFYELYPNARLLALQNDSKTRPGYIPAVPKSTIEQKVKREDGRTETATIPFSKLSAADRKKVTEARALRTRTLTQIKTEDWDGIIMSHSQFERLPLSPETASSFIEEQLDEVEQAITEAKEGKVDKRTLGSIENQKKKLEEKLDAVMKTDPRDIGIPFEQLGIDQIFVDEADMFKNLHYTTSMDRVNGLPNSNANRSMDMYAKTRWLTNANGGRGVVFATGTPVSNTMAEMFTMMRYLDFQGLKEKGLNLFDNWLRAFGEIGSGIERNPSGSGFRKVNKVPRFINMPELTKMFRKFADVKTQDDLDLDIPKLKGGKPTIVKIAPDPVLTNYIKNEVPRRIANMAKRREDMKKGADNMLALTGDLRKMSITDSKIDALADEVARKYEETTDVKGAQLIFCDQGIPKAEKDNVKDDEEGEDNSAEAENAPVYNKIIAALEERGIPKEQIAFIQSAKNKAQMEEIFKKVDSGDIRVLIGSTQKMGAGTNCQHHLVALHDLDAPWRPRDLEQRHGRILRQGNPNKEVEIFNYVLQDSFDPIMWEKLKNKASIVAQAMSSNMQQRTVEDADLVTLTYADAENAGTSDPLVKERIALDSEIKKYKHAQVAFNRKMSEAERTMETAPKRIEELKDAIAKIKEDISARQDTRGDRFRMVISGKEYTERKEAQAALDKVLAGLTSKVSVKVGEISGFDLKAYAGSDGMLHVQLVRKRAYLANTSSVVGIESTLRRAPETMLEACTNGLNEAEADLTSAKEIVGQKNPYAEKLATMEKRFKEINQQIEKNMLGKADDSEENADVSEERYSAEEQLTADSRAWKETLREAWKGDMPDSTMLPVMQTPVSLKLVGVPDYPMVMRQSKLMKIKNDHPEMTKAILNQLPSYLADPMIIFKSSTVPGRLVVGLELKDEAGINVVVPVELNAKSGRVDVNVITSAYGRGENNHTQTQYSWFIKNIVDGNAVYVNKKQAADFYQSAGLQLPMEGRRFNDLFGSSIKTDADLVKAKAENPERYFAEERQKEQVRALDELKQEVRDALPGARDIRDDGDRLLFTMPNGAKVEVQLSPSIEVSDTAAGRARAAHGINPSARVKINGRERTIGTTALVELSQLGRKGSAYHEVLHAVYDLCLTEKEKAALHRAFDKEAKAQGRDVYEVMADQYRDWMLARRQGRGTRFGKLWQKVKDMAAGLLRVLRKADNVSDVFRNVESGKVWERSARTNGEGEDRYLVTNAEVRPDTKVPIIDVTNEMKVNVDDHTQRASIARSLMGKKFRIISSTGEGRIETLSEGEHFVHSSNNPVRFNSTRRKALSVADKILNNCVYIEKHPDMQHHTSRRYIELFSVVKDGGKLVRFRVVAREGQENSGEFTIGTARFYDIIKNGVLPDNGTNDRYLTGRTPSALTVADLLKGVKDRQGNLYVNEDGSLNYDMRIFQDGREQVPSHAEESNEHYSAEAEEAPRNFADKVFLKLTGRSHINGDKIIVEERKAAKGIDDVLGVHLRSPSRIALKVARFRLFWRMGDRAMNMLTKNRSYYMRKMAEAMKLVKDKDDRQMLYEVMLQGDAESKEYTRQELADMGAGDNIIEAYVRLRRLIKKAYHMIDDARRRPVIHSKHLADSEIADLRDNPFVEVMAVGDADDTGRKLVTYKEYANYQKEYQGIDAETLQRFREDDSMQVLDERRNVDGTYDVKVREGVPHLNQLKGYIPHFFHEYMVRILDKDGNYVATLGSGRTECEAVRLADDYLKDHELEAGQTIHVSPKIFSFNKLGMDEGQYGAVMGDSDYEKMIGKLAQDNDMTLAEAREFVGDSVRRKSRHRFFGNTMHRTGVEGYEKNLDWVLRHYFSSASRYAAMETEFKPHAISLYERLYGDFYRDAPSAEANYVKQYINDLNGNPSWLEKEITNLLNHSRIWRNFFVPHYGERAALTFANDVTHVTSSLCLGFLSTSSAILNFTQAMNAAAYIGDVSALVKCITKGAHRKYSMHDLKILNETNVLNNIGLDSGSGYDMNRGSAKRIWGKIDRVGMWMFKTSEGIVRRGTVLAAYEAGRKRGMSHAEAIEFAKDVNRKSNFDYGVADAPNIFRRGSVFSQLGLQFKKYGIKEMEAVFDMLPGNNKTSMKQKAIFWGAYFLLAGMMGVPALDWLDSLFDDKLKLSIESHMMEWAGNDPVKRGLVKTYLFGGLASTLNIDLSNRAGLSDVIPTKMENLLGPAVSKAISFTKDSIQGNGMNAIRDVSPGIYNIIAAGVGHSEGKRGRINDRYETAYDRILRAMGFKSTDERVNSDIDRIVRMRKSEQTSKEQDAIDRYIDEPSAENHKKLQDMGITDKRVETEREKKKQDRRERTSGGMSKKSKPQNERLLQFGE